MTMLELVAVCFGLACVALYVRQNVWSWPVGLVQVCLYVWIFFQARLYSDVLLHLVYVVLQLYGWYVWTRPGAGAAGGRVTRLTPTAFAGWLCVGAISSAALGAAMHGCRTSHCTSQPTARSPSKRPATPTPSPQRNPPFVCSSETSKGSRRSPTWRPRVDRNRSRTAPT